MLRLVMALGPLQQSFDVLLGVIVTTVCNVLTTFQFIEPLCESLHKAVQLAINGCHKCCVCASSYGIRS